MKSLSAVLGSMLVVVATGFLPNADKAEASSPLSVNLVATSCEQIGQKAIYQLRATASGGTGSYTFSWQGGVDPSSTPPTANRNLTSIVVLAMQDPEVTVQSGSEQATDQVWLFSPCW